MLSCPALPGKACLKPRRLGRLDLATRVDEPRALRQTRAQRGGPRFFCYPLMGFLVLPSETPAVYRPPVAPRRDVTRLLSSMGARGMGTLPRAPASARQGSRLLRQWTDRLRCGGGRRAAARNSWARVPAHKAAGSALHGTAFDRGNLSGLANYSSSGWYRSMGMHKALYGTAAPRK